MNAQLLPVSSNRSVGYDPEPYVYPDGGRSNIPTYLRSCFYAPRAHLTHIPVAPSELFCQFREEWADPYINGAYDLGEYAENILVHLTDDGSRETRLFQRFLVLLAVVLPRPYAQFRQERDLALQSR